MLNRFVKGKEDGGEAKMEQKTEVGTTQQTFNQGSEEDLTTIRQRIYKR